MAIDQERAAAALELVAQRMALLEGQCDAMAATLYRISAGVSHLAGAMTMNEIGDAASDALKGYRAALNRPSPPGSV